MAVAAEAYTPEVIDRRTDDILHNVLFLKDRILDRESGSFLSGAEADVLEQDITEIAEADIHALGPIVTQDLDDATGQYRSLGIGTFDNARNGYEAIDIEDEDGWFELGRRLEEVIDEGRILEPETNAQMRAGGVKLMASPEPTPDEADLEVASSFGYDGRSMFRLQRLSPDGKRKTMQSFSMFGVSAEVWAAYLGNRFGTEIEPTALAVMRFCNDMPIQHGSTEDILRDFVGGLSAYLEESKRSSLDRQLGSFLNEQDELRAHADYYGREKLAIEKELALCYGDYARRDIHKFIANIAHKLNDEDKFQLATRYEGEELFVERYVAELVIKMKTVTIDNRAGLATLNEYTVKRLASKIGLEATLQLAENERYLQTASDSEFLARRNEQVIAESGAGCGGGCSVEIVDLFSREARTATEAGLSGTLYSSSELDKGSKCGCAKNKKQAKVLSDGRNVVCVTCGTYKVGGVIGTLSKSA